MRLMLALVGAFGVVASNALDCLLPGEFDTTLNFEGKSTSKNNLGGQGCDNGSPRCWDTHCGTCGDQKIVYENVGVAGSDTAYPGQSFNLVVENTSVYVPANYQWTNIKNQFAEINVDGPNSYSEADTNVALKFCAELSDGTPVTLGTFPMTFYDLCAASPNCTTPSQPNLSTPSHPPSLTPILTFTRCFACCSDGIQTDDAEAQTADRHGLRGGERLYLRGYDSVTPSATGQDGTTVHVDQEDGWTRFSATVYGIGADNPASSTLLNDEQEKKAVTAAFKVSSLPRSALAPSDP